MKKYNSEAFLICIGLIVMGFFIYKGISNFSQGSRIVSVKGLAEIEVQANKVSWPLVYKEVGNNMSTLYSSINSKNEAIINFLKDNGVSEGEISVSSPQVIDLNADRYNRDPVPYRYNATSVVTVTSSDVDKIRKLTLQQSVLLKQGIAISEDDYRYRISYEFTKLNDIKPQMIEDATKNARAAAEKFAEDSDSKLGKIKRANQGQFSIYDRDNNTPHIKTVRVVTSVDYFLKD